MILKNKTLYFLTIILPFILFATCSPPENFRSRNIRHDYPSYLRYDVISTAKKYLGTGYKAGGSSPSGFDCSGFTMFVFKENGINLPRNSEDQFLYGDRKALKTAKSGDLVFFRTEGGKISHVGIYIEDLTFIHSPGTGKEVSFASIKNSYWKRRYIGTISYFKE